ncbi:MAG: Tyrosine-tRNA ligase [Candidatus Woesebacteria bacterium GW2011_GWB1_38_5b]|uniref:Tyrosine--tRNA ligase n=1 Tax=Candidatus Woesebacteria bacterium GW2011_GWB1_38_5b TaxID=1618569 RepID=A0A0G0K6G5_9BACT|nr:MAG: Tyrosine-tRNA ligase [Candidatus Woesebacteria bacterium GW2011_GWB1_38_5b]
MSSETSQLLSELEDKLTNLKQDLSSLSADQQYEMLASRAVHVIQPELLRKRLRKAKEDKKPLLIKYGIDPTGKDLHLGHIVPIIVARRLLQMGHKIALVFGDFTAFIGDPTGRVDTRPILSPEQIEENVSEYRSQVGKFIDLSKVEIVFNSTFYQKMSIRDLMSIYRANRLSPLLQREDFRNRMEGLTIAEALYPTLMAIDSLFMKPHIELGGNDQFLNFEITVEVMKSQGLPPECAITTELLLGTSGDGTKMSKSRGNFISLRDTANDTFGKVMSIPDSLLEHYFTLLTDITNEDWSALSHRMSQTTLNPMEVKKLLARILVTLLYSREEAYEAQKHFEKVFSSRQLPEEIPSLEVEKPSSTQPWVELLVAIQLVKSKREARELITNGALRLLNQTGEWEQITNIEANLPETDPFTIKLGKRKFASVRILPNR